MTRWRSLMPVALVGTDKHSGLETALCQLRLSDAGPTEHPAHEAWDALTLALRQPLSPDTAAQVLLRTAGCLSAVERAAHQAPAAPAIAAPPSLDDDQAALLQGPWPERLSQVLSQGPAALQYETLQTLHLRGWRLPARLLPQALTLARQQPALREITSATVGQRGRWLALQSAHWRDALSAPADPSEEDWLHGNTAARQAFLRLERERDPSAARARLQSSLPELAAKERADLLPCLALGLSGEDEALLQALLKDRAADVRRWAAALLLRLPNSAHRHYMVAQATPLLQSQSAFLGLGKRWVLETPAQEDPEWKAHGIEPVRPKHDSLGERAWWLYQVVRGLPLEWWSEHTGLNPEALVEWSAKTDWREALLRGWRDALAVAPADAQEAWAWALLGAEAQGATGLDADALRGLLSPSRRVQLWAQQLRQEPAAVWAIAQNIVASCSPADRLPPELSQALARAAVTKVRSELNQTQSGWAYPARQWMPLLCAHLDLSALPLLAQLSTPDDPTPAFIELQAQLMRLQNLRQALTQLPLPTP
ncbi:DUF5691 domain-containing protein [Ideonella sp.]|jgi:hypothetical protein|uniref:DUF5691 domain-containing protein n=1 Tax=Ideonella sp. TaxID=1929293 RepID=UPI0037BEA19E